MSPRRLILSGLLYLALLTALTSAAVAGAAWSITGGGV